MRAASLQASSCLPPSASHSLTSSIFFLSSKRVLKSLKKKQLPFLFPFFFAAGHPGWAALGEQLQNAASWRVR